MNANIVAVYNKATAEELVSGAEWYSAAHTFCRGLSDRYDVDIDTAAAVVAVLSPRLSWALNLRYADQYLRTGDCPTFFSVKHKLARLVEGVALDEVLSARHGQKVRSFYDNIARPQTSTAVTVDRHAFDIVTGSRHDADRRALERRGVYDATAEEYRSTALALNLRPHQLQATTWLTWKRVKNYNDQRHATQFSGTGAEHLSASN